MLHPSSRSFPILLAAGAFLVAVAAPAVAQPQAEAAAEILVSKPAPLRLELSGTRRSEGASERFAFSIHLRGGMAAQRFEALAIVSLPSETPLFVTYDAGAESAVDLALRFTALGAKHIDRRGLETIDRRLEVAIDDPAVMADDRIAVWAFEDGVRVELARAAADGGRFGLVAEMPATAPLV